MLSAKKVRMHCMEDARWSTKDKLSQYKGLINLYLRDKKIIEHDTFVERRKQIREVKRLQKDIVHSRNSLDNAVRGDRQQLRNTLAEHKNMQLAYQNLHPTIVIDHLFQNNFNKRKELDLTIYKMKQRSQILINLKLEKAVLEDRIKYEDRESFPVEELSQIVTGKVQDAILKKEAALAVGQSYRSILSIMKKDAIYFDSVLATLKVDALNQGKCMIQTTEMGQLATEYLDDRKQEFHELEIAVKRDLKERMSSLKCVQEQENKLNNNLKYLIRKDSDVNVGKITIQRTNSELNLQKDSESLEKILEILKQTTLVSNFQAIFPCLEEQRKQNHRLRELVQKNEADRDTLLNKKNHAETMLTSLENTMNDTTFEYKDEKQRLLKAIEVQKQRRIKVNKTIVARGGLLVNVRKALQHLQQICKPITPSSDLHKEKSARFKRISYTSEISATVEYVEEDTNIIISNLQQKLIKLVNAAGQELDKYSLEHAYHAYQNFISEITKSVAYEADISHDDSLIDDVMGESGILTRFDIKNKSKEIVEANTKSEFDIPTL